MNPDTVLILDELGALRAEVRTNCEEVYALREEVHALRSENMALHCLVAPLATRKMSRTAQAKAAGCSVGTLQNRERKSRSYLHLGSVPSFKSVQNPQRKISNSHKK